MAKTVIVPCLFLALATFPQAEISNRVIKAKLLLPHLERGYYRGMRFDWGGVIESLTYQGHNFFGQWFDKYDPTLHDAIMGPVEEFRSEDGALGYDAAKPGGYFVKVGVGVLKRVDDKPYFFANTYPIVNPGVRTVVPEHDRVSFRHELNDGEGYAYVYRKTVRLAGNKPELIIEHSLKNTGKKVIETSVYNHNFYMIDAQPTGPAYRVKFAFEPHAETGFKDLAAIQGHDIVYKRELAAKGESVASAITGFGGNPKENDIIVENSKAGVGVREIGNRPLSKLYFWSIRSTVCPEAYIHMRIEPGKTFSWKITYRFYETAR